MPEEGILEESCEIMNSTSLDLRPRVLSQELSFENLISLLDEVGRKLKMR